MYTVIQVLSTKDKSRNSGHNYYLNHAYLNRMEFGSVDMQWQGTHAEAIAMLEKAKRVHAGKRLRFQIEDVG